MHNLLLHFYGSPTLNATVFPPHLYLYDDMLVYKKRGVIRRKEMSISYTHLSQVTVIKGIFYAQVEVHAIGSEIILIRFVPNKIAEHAKKIIDQKVFFSHPKHKTDSSEPSSSINNVEKAILRYKELLNRGVITKSQFDKKTSEAIKGIVTGGPENK